VLPFLILPIAAPTLTVSQHPGRLAAALALFAAAGPIALGIAGAALMSWAESNHWNGDRCCEAMFSTPWATWELLMLVYSGLAAALFGALVIALLRARCSTPQSCAARAEGEAS
jgi:hypothetical protein